MFFKLIFLLITFDKDTKTCKITHMFSYVLVEMRRISNTKSSKIGFCTVVASTCHHLVALHWTSILWYYLATLFTSERERQSRDGFVLQARRLKFPVGSGFSFASSGPGRVFQCKLRVGSGQYIKV